MLHNLIHIVFALLIATAIGCQSNPRKTVGKRLKPNEKVEVKDYHVDQTDKLLEKQRKNKTKKDKYDKKKRAEEVRKIESESNKDKEKAKKKPLNDGEFKFY